MRIVYENADGTVSLTFASASAKRMMVETGMTELEYLQSRIDIDKPEGAIFRAIVEDHELPDHGGLLTEPVLVDEVTLTVQDLPMADQKRGMREAWKWNGTGVEVDSVRATDLQWERVREVRNQALLLTDIDVIKASDAGDTAKVVALNVLRNQLRDLPQTEADPFAIVWPTKPV